MPQSDSIFSAFIGSVVGSIVAMFVKHHMDQLTEHHKVSLSLAAKGRERFNEKQSVALAGVYEKVTKAKVAAFYFYNTLGLWSQNEMNLRDTLSSIAEKQEEDFQAALIELETFLTLNDYLLSNDLALEANGIFRLMDEAGQEYLAEFRESKVSNDYNFSEDTVKKVWQEIDSISKLYISFKNRVHDTLRVKDEVLEPKIKRDISGLRARFAGAYDGWKAAGKKV